MRIEGIRTFRKGGGKFERKVKERKNTKKGGYKVKARGGHSVQDKMRKL